MLVSPDLRKKGDLRVFDNRIGNQTPKPVQRLLYLRLRTCVYSPSTRVDDTPSKTSRTTLTQGVVPCVEAEA
jgi:hypothetical protein